MTPEQLPSELPNPSDGFQDGAWAWEIIRHAEGQFSVRLIYEDPDYVNDCQMVFPEEDLDSLLKCFEYLLERVSSRYRLIELPD